MRENFTKALAIELKYEGGFSNHKRDPGGVTLEGVIQRVYDAYRRRKGLPIRPLTPQMRGSAQWIAERNDIYRAQYWNAIRGDELPAGVDLVVFDGAINSGPYQSIKWLQRALGVEADGHLGEGTLAALMLNDDHDKLIADILSRRLGMLQQLSTWSDFGKGWSARVASARKIGQAWATGSVGPEPVAAHTMMGDAKAYASDVAQPAVDAHTAGTTGAGSAGFAAVVQMAQEKLSAFVGTSDFVTNVYIGLTVVSVALAAGGVIYSFWSSRKSRKARLAIDGELMADVPEGQPA